MLTEARAHTSGAGEEEPGDEGAGSNCHQVHLGEPDAHTWAVCLRAGSHAIPCAASQAVGAAAL